MSPKAAKRREERGCMRVVAGGPQFSSRTPGKHGRRKQDFQTPVQNREDRNPAPWPLEPRRALCGKAPDRRWASPAPGSRGEKGKPAGEERRRGGGAGAGAPGRLTAAAAREATVALARGPGGAAGLQRRRGCGGRDCGGRHLGALPQIRFFYWSTEKVLGGTYNFQGNVLLINFPITIRVDQFICPMSVWVSRCNL